MITECHPDGSLILQDQVSLPDVLDLLVVGGGPAGTSTAFRAKELGLAALVIDFDDILKRIRDYPKDKLILPNFGGGDRMAFPAAGQCVAQLHFDPIDKDEMCSVWKGYYRALNVPARIGVELTGLEAASDGTWQAVTFNHKTQDRETYLARHVVLALGRGVPRRFDIPGETDGIAYRLDDPARYVQGPVCVIGGGTSAAEAVIAVSQAKIEGMNESPVYWSYRGAKMPRVSKALSDTFFEAYVGNGNVRYHPHSEPVAVVTGPDRQEYLSIRVDRRELPDRPHETSHLEFLKTRCVACIGEDIPRAFLSELGIEMVTVDGDGKPMMVVTPLLETQQRNVYLVGDLLSQAYLETDDFAAPPAQFRRVKHRGNIKSSLRDGVFVAEVIQQRLEGRSSVVVNIRDAPATPVAPSEEDAGAVTEILHPVGRPDVPPPATVPGDRGTVEAAHLVRLTPAGVEADEYPLATEGVTTIGRTGCDLSFPEDTLLSEQHASITERDGDLRIRDDGSRTGTFLKLRPGKTEAVGPGGLLRVGRQILLVAGDGAGFQIRHFDAAGKPVGRYPIRDGTVVMGRSGGRSDPDVVLDDGDRTLSRFHLAATAKGGVLAVEDFNSRNGTFLKVDGVRKLEHGDIYRMGGQVFRVQLVEDLPAKTGSFPIPKVEAPVAEPEVTAAPAPPAAPAGEARVTFAGQDVSATIEPSESILDVADAHDVVMDYECWAGMCGCDLIRIVQGREHLNEPDATELKTLNRKGMEPGEFRLACKTHCSGPVVVEVVD